MAVMSRFSTSALTSGSATMVSEAKPSATEGYPRSLGSLAHPSMYMAARPALTALTRSLKAATCRVTVAPRVLRMLSATALWKASQDLSVRPRIVIVIGPVQPDCA